MSLETPTLNARTSAPFLLRRWVMGWAMVAGVLALLLANGGALDTFLWRATRWAMGSQDAYQWEQYRRPAGEPGAAWYQTLEPPLHGKLYKRTEKLWRILRDMGEPYFTVLLLAAVWVYDRRNWRAAGLLLAGTAAAGGLSALLRYATGRLRPNGELPGGRWNEGANIWEPFRALWVDGTFPFVHMSGGDLSFSSGHATLAFATAAVLSYLSPRGRWLFVSVAAGCALARVVMQAHFYSDVLVGGALGYSIGMATARGLAQLTDPE